MGIKVKPFASALALGFGLLAFGPATSTAKADHVKHGKFHKKAVVHGSFAPVRHRAYVRPYHRYASRVSFAYPYPRPYRLVRVLVYDPFPRWVYRRVYYAANVGPYRGY